jgi:xanthine dehydrogenase YagS FAD-binding subunit
MRPFVYERASSESAAVQMAAGAAPTAFLAGGTTLIDLMKLDVLRPDRLIDINALSQGPAGRIQSGGDGLRLGALVPMAEAAEHATIRRDYPVVADALRLAASQQIRNMASLGGNLLQRTRCPYFRDTSWRACNRRNPGSGCAAIGGVNRGHAVLGTSSACIATYPGDLAVALVALDAEIEILGPDGSRTMPLAELHRPPGDTPHIETALAPGQLISAIRVPAGPWTRRSLFLKIRDRESYQFALASVAVALELKDRVVQTARVALGGVATIPWRARRAEEALVGRRLDAAAAGAAGDAAVDGAQTYSHNGFKVALAKHTVERALVLAGRMET